jgi:hypothetical protein
MLGSLRWVSSTHAVEDGGDCDKWILSLLKRYFHKTVHSAHTLSVTGAAELVDCNWPAWLIMIIIYAAVCCRLSSPKGTMTSEVSLAHNSSSPTTLTGWVQHLADPFLHV